MSKPSTRIKEIISTAGKGATYAQQYQLRRDLEISAIMQYLDEAWVEKTGAVFCTGCFNLIKDGGLCKDCNNLEDHEDTDPSNI